MTDLSHTRALIRQLRATVREVAATPSSHKPLLVGELNPFGGHDYFALFPTPRTSSGGRLASILGLTDERYLALFDRANLCRGSWSVKDARKQAAELGRPAFVLLGSKVCAGFDVAYTPFTVGDGPGGSVLAVLPHPSRLNRIWNAPRSVEFARRTIGACGIDLTGPTVKQGVRCANCGVVTVSGYDYDCQNCGRS